MTQHDVIQHDVGGVELTETLEINDIPTQVIIKEVPVEVIVEKEVIKEVEKIVEVPVEKIVEVPVKEEVVNPDVFASSKLRRPDGSTLELKRDPAGVDKLQGSVVDGTDPGTLTKRDRVNREINPKTGQKRIDPWTGNLRWQKARYEKNNEDPNKE